MKQLLRYVTCLTLMLIPYVSGWAQQGVVEIDIDSSSLRKRIVLESFPWKFAPGDSLQWARRDFDDSSWQSVLVNFGSDKLPAGWIDYGWFRLWVKKSPQSPFDTWALYLNHDAASEVYYDGVRVAAYGKFGYTKAEVTPVRKPFVTAALAITDTLPHLLAVRFSNPYRYFDDFLGFQAWIGEHRSMDSTFRQQQRFHDKYLLSGAVQAMLLLIHLLLFVFYPKNKQHLYYCAFVFISALALWSRYETVVTTNPAMQLLAYKLFALAILLIPPTGVLLLYRISYRILPKWRVILLSVVSTTAIIYLLTGNNFMQLVDTNSPFNVFNNIFAAVTFADGLRAVVVAIRRGNKRLWLIAVGMAVVGAASIFVGSNLLGMFSFQQVMATMAIVTLVVPVIFSIYLAMDVAHTTRRLERQTEELEQRVLERTTTVRQQAARLKEMDEAKSRFFVNLTHEFKTPLTLILNPAKALLDQPDTNATKQYAQYILQSSERLLELVNQLLDLSKLETRQMEISLVSLDAVKWLRAHLAQYESLAGAKKIELIFRSNVQKLHLQTDADKLQKIVQNLLSNAIKFTDTGGVVTLRVDELPDQQWELLVEDTGVGIPASKLSYVFDRFYQVDNKESRMGNGTGIGLALVKELTELMGGTVSVESSEGEGTRFWVKMPLLSATPETAFSSAIPEKADSILSATMHDAPPGIHNEPTILVVEDNALLRNFIKQTLARFYRVVLAEDGEAGWQLAVDEVPDLIVSDLMMPKKDGYELCAALRSDIRTSHIPIILLTAKSDINSKIQGIATGADAYLPKPFDEREFLTQISSLLKSRELLKQKYAASTPASLTFAPELPSMEQQFLQQVVEYIVQHLDDEGLGPEQLGREVGLSRTQLHRKLKAVIDQSPGDLIRKIRLQTAHELLEKRAGTVSEVAYRVGFGNPANFSTSFSRFFGYPPSDVVKRSENS